LSPLFYISLQKRGDNVHEVQLCVVKHKKEVTMCMKYSSIVKHKKEVTMSMKHSIYIVTSLLIVHYTELHFMHIVTSFLCFTTQSCTSCTLLPLFYVSLQSCTSCILSPLFYVSLHRVVPHVHCHLFFVVKYKKEVTMYM
jgi:hypothetical protein